MALREGLKPDLGHKSTVDLDGERYVFEPGDATHYDIAVVSTSGHGALLVMVCPDRGVVPLPESWQEGVGADYIAEKLRCNQHTSEVVAAALAKIASGAW